MQNDFYPTGNELRSNIPELVHTGAHTFEQEWLSVEQAVVYCAELGLTRTPKTVRKWAERSSGLPDGDVIARKEDTPWGYKWQIEKVSLTRKVEEELELRTANSPELVRTSSPKYPKSEPEKTLENVSEPSANEPEHVHTGANQFLQQKDDLAQQKEPEPSAHMSAPVQTGSDMELILDEVRARLSDKDEEITFLRDRLADAQAEIERRATSTDDALKTIDRVVRSFEMQAETNRARTLGTGHESEPVPEQTRPIHFASETVDNSDRHQDIRRV